MPMSDQIKRIVAVCVVAAWVSLFGVTMAEAFGYFHDTPEHADQTIEQVLSTPADDTISLSDQFTTVQHHVALISAVIDPDPHAAQLAYSIACRAVAQGPPLRHPPKLFQLFSVYRL